MARRTSHRLQDILTAIEHVERLLTDQTFETLTADHIKQAAFERFLEIISEASRHIPEEMKRSAPGIPWRNVADIGNQTRHAYHLVDTEILWLLYADGQLAKLKAAVEYLKTKFPEA